MTTSSENLLTAFQTLLCYVSTDLLTEAMSALRNELGNRPDGDRIYDVWQVSDVRGRRPDLDDEQCWKVLRSIERNHNAEVGINWDVIDFVADKLYPEPDNLLELREEYES